MFPFFLIPKADIVSFFPDSKGRHCAEAFGDSCCQQLYSQKQVSYYEQALEVVNFKCTLFSTSHAPFDLINRQ